MYIRIDIHSHAYYICICICICICIYIYIYILTYTYKRTQIYAHSHIQTFTHAAVIQIHTDVSSLFLSLVLLLCNKFLDVTLVLNNPFSRSCEFVKGGFCDHAATSV